MLRLPKFSTDPRICRKAALRTHRFTHDQLPGTGLVLLPSLRCVGVDKFAAAPLAEVEDVVRAGFGFA